MAGTVTLTEVTHTSVKKITWSWTSTSGGAADKATTVALDGRLIRFETVPDGTTAPTTLYDVTLTDADGRDLLGGNGADRSATVTEYIAELSLLPVAGSVLTLNVTNAGNAKKGTATVWIR